MVLRSRSMTGATQRSKAWGVDSEYGVLRDVLLGPSDHFAWMISNAVMARSERIGRRFDRKAAVAQHRELADAFREAGVVVHQLKPDANLPYQIFARDSSVMTPWGAIIMQLQKPFRRGEYAECIRFYLESDIPIYDLLSAGNAEGGDLMVLQPGVAICGYSGERSTEPALLQLQHWFEAEGWQFRTYAFDPHFLHLDVQFCMLAEGLAVLCAEAVESSFIAWLRSRNIRTIDISYRDAMEMGCNVVALGGGRVLIPASCKDLVGICRAEGLTVLDPDVSMIAAAGGGIHCLCQPLRRDAAA